MSDECVLVTGAAGLVGNAVRMMLEKADRKVVAIDRMAAKGEGGDVIADEAVEDLQERQVRARDGLVQPLLLHDGRVLGVTDERKVGVEDDREVATHGRVGRLLRRHPCTTPDPQRERDY